MRVEITVPKKKKKFQDFYDSLEKDEYTSTKIVQKYNNSFNVDQSHQISNKGFGQLIEAKQRFSKKQKDIGNNNKKVMIYKKK